VTDYIPTCIAQSIAATQVVYDVPWYRYSNINTNARNKYILINICALVFIGQEFGWKEGEKGRGVRVHVHVYVHI
jgi:hypothetical protein